MIALTLDFQGRRLPQPRRWTAVPRTGDRMTVLDEATRHMEFYLVTAVVWEDHPDEAHVTVLLTWLGEGVSRPRRGKMDVGARDEVDDCGPVEGGAHDGHDADDHTAVSA